MENVQSQPISLSTKNFQLGVQLFLLQQNNDNNYNNGNGGSSNQSGPAPKHNNPAFGNTCHYYKKKNHFQAECFKRKRENGAMVKVKEIQEQDPALESIFKTSKN